AQHKPLSRSENRGGATRRVERLRDCHRCEQRQLETRRRDTRWSFAAVARGRAGPRRSSSHMRLNRWMRSGTVGLFPDQGGPRARRATGSDAVEHRASYTVSRAGRCDDKARCAEAIHLYPLFYPLVKNFRHYMSVREMM